MDAARMPSRLPPNGASARYRSRISSLLSCRSIWTARTIWRSFAYTERSRRGSISRASCIVMVEPPETMWPLLPNCSAARQRIDAAMRPEPPVFIRQQQLEISGVDGGLGIDRQPPASVRHRIGAQQLAIAVDDGGGNFSRLFQRQRPERNHPGGEGGGDYDEHEGKS